MPGVIRSNYVPLGSAPVAPTITAPADLPIPSTSALQSPKDVEPPAPPKNVEPPVPPQPQPKDLLDPVDPATQLPPGLKLDVAVLDLPSSDRIFRDLENEDELRVRLKQVADSKRLGIRLDKLDPPSTEPFKTRAFPPNMMVVEPAYVVYRPLFFEEVNSERYGWELGGLQPIVSTLHFYKEVLFLPHNAAREACRCFDTNAGWYLPGDPVPYTIYPPDFSWYGGLAQAGVVAGLFLAIP